MRPLLPMAALLCCFMLAFLQGRSQSGNGNSSDRKFLRAKLYAANGNIADGNMVAFDDDFSNGYDGYDAIKMMNPGENFGMRRDGRTLAVEARNVLTVNDTIYYDIRNLAQQTYQIKFAGQFFTGTSIMGMLKDNFTGITTPVSLTDSVFFFFNVNSNAGSKAFDRFHIYFIDMVASAVLPVKFSSVQLQNGKSSVFVNWKVEEEQNVDRYEIERSSNGSQFKPLAVVASKSSGAGRNAYSYEDMEANATDIFYRITAKDKDGRKTISSIVKAVAANITAQMTAWPNPLTSPQLQLKLNNVAKGHYQLSISSMLGQKLHSSIHKVTDGNSQLQINLGTNMVNGQYIVSLTGEDGNTLQQQLLIKK